jgi:hypothetical protein
VRDPRLLRDGAHRRRPGAWPLGCHHRRHWTTGGVCAEEAMADAGAVAAGSSGGEIYFFILPNHRAVHGGNTSQKHIRVIKHRILR